MKLIKAKNISGIILSSAMMFIILSMGNVSAALSGDANGDGKLDVRDVAYIAKMVAKGETGQPYSAADYNRDGKVDIRDAAAIARKNAVKAGTKTQPASFNEFVGEYNFGGFGGNYTTLKLKKDGSFTGEYKNYELGISGSGYDSTVLMNNFSGKFTGMKKINEYTYQVSMSALKYTYKPNTSKIADRTLYEYCKADVIEGAKTAYIYKKGAPVRKLPREFVDSTITSVKRPSTLPFNGIYFVDRGGFKGE